MSILRNSTSKLLVGIVLFAGLPLVGWGVTDVRGFIGHSARLAYVALAILLQVIAVVMVPAGSPGGGEGRKTVRRQRVAVFLLQVLSLAIILVAPYSDHAQVIALDESMVTRSLGLILVAAGFLLINWAEAALGKQFSVQVTLQEDHRLVTDGPFRYLRHPRYLGVTLFSVGIALVFCSGLALILAAALVGVLLWRIFDEEMFMRQAFGDEWDAYVRRSWRLIPFVY